jgi:hypothetical protein
MKLIRGKVPSPFAALLLLVLLSCVDSTITMRDLTALRMGMGIDDTHRAMGVPPKEVLHWSMSRTGDSIIVQSYFLATGDYSTTYLLAYRNDALIFWGYPQEFARSSDPVIREIGKEAIRRHVR